MAKLPIFLKDSDYFDFKQIMRYFLIGFPEPKVSDTLGSMSFSQRWRLENKPVSFAADPAGNGMFKGILDLLAYCLMPNHFHFLVRIREQESKGPLDPAKSISEFMKRLGITYAMKFNFDNQ